MYKSYIINILLSLLKAAPDSSSVSVISGFLFFSIIYVQLIMYIMTFVLFMSTQEPKGHSYHFDPPMALFSDYISLNSKIWTSFCSSIILLQMWPKRSITNYSSKDMFYCLTFLNVILIVISNPSILNPGPNNINVCYSNVQGFIPFTKLKEKHPELCKIKIIELNTYLSSEKPGIIILNETWLKSLFLTMK